MLLRRIAAVALVTSGALLAAQFIAGPATTAESPALLSGSGLTPPPAAMDTDVSSAAEESPIIKTLKVGKGDTLMKLLTGVGVPSDEAHAAITVLREHFDPRRMSIGQTIDVEFDPGESLPEVEPRFTGLSIVPDYDRMVRVARVSDADFKAFEEERELTEKLAVATGVIETSLYDAAVEAGLPQGVLLDMIHAYSWDVDFQRDIQSGDTFTVMYERYFDDGGSLVHNGEILRATMTLSGQKVSMYRHISEDGNVEYFDEMGRGARKALMRTPVNGARLSSGFGKRRHPILGYSKMHTGVDFAAPPGTPIYAAGDGTVDKAGWNGGYGRYIRIRHNTEYATAYGHMRGFAKGIRSGKRVKQGQIIGYVGSTGRSTGPHLHYEILRNGAHTNPMKVRMPSGRQLKGKELARFKTESGVLDAQFTALVNRTEVASTNE